MLKRRARVHVLSMGLLDILTVLASYLLAFLLRWALASAFANPLGISLHEYVALLVLVLPIWGGLFAFFHLYSVKTNTRFSEEVWRIVKAVFFGIILINTAIVVLKLENVSRSVMSFFALISILLLVAERACLRSILRSRRRRGINCSQVLVVGAGQRARSFVGMLTAHPEWGLRICGLIDEDPSMLGKTVDGISVVGQIKDIAAHLDRKSIDEVVFVAPIAWMEHIEKAIMVCEEVGVQATVVMDYFGMRSAKPQSMDLYGLPLITYSMLPPNEIALVAKHFFDFALGLALLIVLSPLMLVVAIAIRATSHGPVVFRQTRVGVNGRTFELFKFRTMVADAEKKQADLLHLNEKDGPVFKVKNDPRITRIGRLLRRTSIDELPQLINVLKGEMSLVGPRPPLPAEVRQYERWQRRRLSMKPGITGLWQVSGRSELSFDEWMRLDLAYIDSWSFWADLAIILRTIVVVIRGQGAY